MFNFGRALDRNADRNPGGEAVVFEETRLTHIRLFERVNALAAALAARGVQNNDVVAILLHNCSEFFETTLAVNRIGAIFLPLNFRLAVPEWTYILGHSGASWIVTEPKFADAVTTINQELEEGMRVVMVSEDDEDLGETYDSLLREHEGAVVDIAPTPRDAVQRIMYTSGTTSRPKGVPITHENVLWKTFGHVIEFDITSADRTLMAGPMYHVGAFDLPGTGTWYVGGSLVILPHFDAEDVLRLIQAERPTNTWLAPAMVNAIMQLPNLSAYDTNSIRFIINGGEKMPVSLIERIMSVFPNAWFSDAYGLTETVSGDTFLDRDHVVNKIGSVGKPVLHLDVRIANPSNVEEDVQVGEQGEILLRGPKVVSSYWKNLDSTAESFADDGWFRTGDVGHFDSDGYLYIDDRIKDMIVSGGENIATPEIERVLYEHPDVVEAAVVGMPDDRWGEVPKAFVVLSQGSATSEDEIIEHCQDQLAKYKAPKSVTFLNELPRTPSGKVLKRELR